VTSAFAHFDPVLLFYAFVAVAAAAIYSMRKDRETERSERQLAKAREAGMDEPATLHPVINESACIGCGACVKACPEGDILGVMRGKARLVEPSSCIGHGACASACPTNAIQLVFGTERRGIDIPFVDPNFQTNVPGLYIAGELGGMGLIRNAVEQGRQAMEEIARHRTGSSAVLDTVIVGAGPAGIAATLKARQARLRFETIEQDSLGGTAAHYPRGKIVMTAPANLPLVGKMKLGETSKEALIAFWQKVERDQQLRISYNERVDAIQRVSGGFEITTSRRRLKSRTVLLAIGRRGTPRKLDVPGEELTKVVYRLVDPVQYRNRHVLVVGGGDSALEAALSLSGEPGTRVTLSHRGPAFSGAKAQNRARVEEAAGAGRLQLLMETNVREITPGSVRLQRGDQMYELQNDDVIVCAGGVLPSQFLRQIGIAVETKYGTA
jgi:thioredoxin reductase/NAD-dependent dihydropyrimidine dehydrogenase PreA subunit